MVQIQSNQDLKDKLNREKYQKIGKRTHNISKPFADICEIPAILYVIPVEVSKKLRLTCAK